MVTIDILGIDILGRHRENVAIGFKTSIEAYFVEKNQLWDTGAARG